MTTLEQTISLIKRLPETKLLEIQRYARKSLQDRSSSSLPEATMEDILSTVQISQKQIANGKYENASEAMHQLRQKYDLHS